MTGMISADAGPSLAALFRRLASRAEALAAAHAEARRMAARGDETRWRRADLVWPLFAKG
ncbi:hypothetical protein ACLIMP_02235 [Novosphingobium aerophilum]|uniref:hypothetical protein n=1 Tax=Novosphingobium TaxID=165696 RepID=UPI0006C86B04|nr:MULTISPECIES: hypothetical protein [unclassified Novosphingobium]KPH57579.1 hypothetical protein ADT71_29055 [Novosphingobium sp. ST904]TCM43172.1 hypothetical protein EDF59_101275 [Novosphingobium sp. ST904]WRT93113.1 hypothetical protein U9J33_00915 [Novosphingobium sp. RL4]